MADDADAIIVGAGLAGLVAAAELVDARRKIIVIDQEPEQSLGGQAFWSLGGLFLVDSPEQRRMGIRDFACFGARRLDGDGRLRSRRGFLAAPMGRSLCRLCRRRKARVVARTRSAFLSGCRLGRTRRRRRGRPRQFGTALPSDLGHRARRYRAVCRPRASRREGRVWSLSSSAIAPTNW